MFVSFYKPSSSLPLRLIYCTFDSGFERECGGRICRKCFLNVGWHHRATFATFHRADQTVRGVSWGRPTAGFHPNRDKHWSAGMTTIVPGTCQNR